MSTWPTVQLGDIFTIARGGSPRPIDAFITNDPEGVNWIMIGDAREGSKYISATKKRIRPDGVSRSRKVKPGDFLLTNSMSFGRPYILNTSGCIHDGWLVLSPRRDGIDADFFYHLLGSPALYAQFAKLAAGAVVKNLNIDLVSKVRVRLPPLAEQRRIAVLLDKADAIRRKRKEAIALTEELLRSTFLEMFGDHLDALERGGLPAGWRRMRVDDIKAAGDYTCVGGPFGSNLTSRDYVSSGVPVIRGGNLGGKTNTFVDEDFVFVSNQKAEELVQNMAYPGDLVFTQRGTLGQVALIPKSARYARYVVSQSQMKLAANADIVNALYLHQFFCSSRMQQYIQSHALTTGVPHINLGILRAMPVLVPPLHVQETFARCAARVRKLSTQNEDALGRACALFDSLSAGAFRESRSGDQVAC